MLWEENKMTSVNELLGNRFDLRYMTHRKMRELHKRVLLHDFSDFRTRQAEPSFIEKIALRLGKQIAKNKVQKICSAGRVIPPQNDHQKS